MSKFKEAKQHTVDLKIIYVTTQILWHGEILWHFYDFMLRGTTGYAILSNKLTYEHDYKCVGLPVN